MTPSQTEGMVRPVAQGDVVDVVVPTIDVPTFTAFATEAPIVERAEDAMSRESRGWSDEFRSNSSLLSTLSETFIK